MATMIDLTRSKLSSSSSSSSSSASLLPIFITCDPARDTPAVLKAYLREFHPDLIGLTGTWEQIKAVCKLYRVYFSTPEGVKPGMDYLVDHSIYFYLMGEQASSLTLPPYGTFANELISTTDPEGDFVEAIGRQHSAERAATIITEHMGDWRGAVKKKKKKT